MNQVEPQSPGFPETTAVTPQVSVVVTTCNRAAGLPQLFTALRDQTVTGRLPWEFILVDNGSIDGTARIAHELGSVLGVPFTYLLEPSKGKSRGLNAGVSRARGSIIAFTDDDGIPAADWLEKLVQYFDRYPDIACVGGRVELFDAADALITVRLSREPKVIDSTTFSVSNVPVLGCNFAVDASTLRSIGPYDVDVGPGSRVGSGDDVDMLYRLVRAGGRIGYDPAPLVLHNHGRRTDLQVKGVQDRYVVGRGAFYCKYLLQADRRVTRWAYWEVTNLLVDWLRRGMITTQARTALRTVLLLAAGAKRYLQQRVAHKLGVAV